MCQALPSDDGREQHTNAARIPVNYPRLQVLPPDCPSGCRTRFGASTKPPNELDGIPTETEDQGLGLVRLSIDRGPDPI